MIDGQFCVAACAGSLHSVEDSAEDLLRLKEAACS